MDTRRCLEILELESVTSPDALKRAYRDMVQIWHPDRFHGNSRLEKLAVAKLKEINHAYHHLLAYFDPEQSQRLRTSNAPFHEQSSKKNEQHNSGIHSGKRTGNSSDAKDQAGDKQTEPFSNFTIYAAPKRSVLGKLIALLLLCIFLAIAGLIIYFALNKEELTSKSMGMASEALDTITNELEKKLAPKIGEGILKNSPPSKPNRQNLSEKIKPTEPRTYFEIHLDGGTIILTESWRQEDDMIIYTQHGGSMGIEKDRVKNIVEKQTRQSELHF